MPKFDPFYKLLTLPEHGALHETRPDLIHPYGPVPASYPDYHYAYYALKRRQNRTTREQAHEQMLCKHLRTPYGHSFEQDSALAKAGVPNTPREQAYAKLLCEHLNLPRIPREFFELHRSQMTSKCFIDDFAGLPTPGEYNPHNPLINPKEQTPMRPNIKIENKTYVNGTDITHLDNEQLFNTIAAAEAEIERLNNIKAKPKKLQSRIKELQDGINALVALSDERV